MNKIKVMSIFGTRPEAIKMCPLILELEKNQRIESVVCVTGQHREMLDQVIEIFGITVNYDLNIMKPRQTLTSITSDILQNIEEVFLKERPNIILVHGDTTTSFAVALAAFYHQIPVGHVEAGLRTYDKYSPFPEEMNRCLTSKIADIHFAPTQLNKTNLMQEGITKNVFVTGNTVLDAFKTTVKKDYEFKSVALKGLEIQSKRLILMTAHRRENLGKPLENICKAVKRVVETFEDVVVVYPVHLNPAVRETVNSILTGNDRIMLIEPIDVQDMHNLMAVSYIAMTDSGGLQEEAPSFGVPVLVLRTETERPEAVEAGTVKVVGVNEDDIYNAAYQLLTNQELYQKMSTAVNPYGDGSASVRIAEELCNLGNN